MCCRIFRFEELPQNSTLPSHLVAAPVDAELETWQEEALRTEQAFRTDGTSPRGGQGGLARLLKLMMGYCRAKHRSRSTVSHSGFTPRDQEPPSPFKESVQQAADKANADHPVEGTLGLASLCSLPETLPRLRIEDVALLAEPCHGPARAPQWGDLLGRPVLGGSL